MFDSFKVIGPAVFPRPKISGSICNDYTERIINTICYEYPDLSHRKIKHGFFTDGNSENSPIILAYSGG